MLTVDRFILWIGRRWWKVAWQEEGGMSYTISKGGELSERGNVRRI